jgi:hypothetical protein
MHTPSPQPQCPALHRRHQLRFCLIVRDQGSFKRRWSTSIEHVSATL